MVGGGIRDSAYCQGVADACGVTVKAGPVEATAIGNIGIQLYGLGAVKSLDELRAVVARSEPITVYTPSEASADYEVAYGRFLGLLRG
jgi:sugar (pentulose or hexulose) kinase